MRAPLAAAEKEYCPPVVTNPVGLGSSSVEWGSPTGPTFVFWSERTNDVVLVIFRSK